MHLKYCYSIHSRTLLMKCEWKRVKMVDILGIVYIRD